ncbi:MAG: hypothetical protein NT010_00280 [Proteobacteria bacterium]|nr:hypothetical protein [Pseudomonadota bacterium]
MFLRLSDEQEALRKKMQTYIDSRSAVMLEVMMPLLPDEGQERHFYILMRGLTNNEDQSIKCLSKEVHGITIMLNQR